MQDRVFWSEARHLTGYGHYYDRYVRGDDGQWRIASVVLTRLYLDYFTKEVADKP